MMLELLVEEILHLVIAVKGWGLAAQYRRILPLYYGESECHRMFTYEGGCVVHFIHKHCANCESHPVFPWLSFRVASLIEGVSSPNISEGALPR